MGGAIDECRLHQVLRQLADEVVEQEDGQRQAKAGVCQPDPEERPIQGVQGQSRRIGTRAICSGTTSRSTHDREQERAAREPHPREGVGCERRDGDRDDHGRDGDDE